MHEFTKELASLDARRKELEQSLRRVEAAILSLTGGTPGTTRIPNRRRGSTRGVQKGNAGEFSSMTILQASKAYLGSVGGGPRRAPEIASAIREGGIKRHSQNFSNTVYSVLYKAEQANQGIEKEGTSWKLAGGKSERGG